MAYRIATNADNLEFSNGPLSGYTMGGYTAAMFLKRNTLATQQACIFLVISGFTFPRFELGFNTSNTGLLITRGASSTTTVTGPSMASSTPWYLLAVTGNGTATPRFHLHDGTSWAHTNASGALTNNPTVGATDRLFLSPPSGWGGEYLKADVVCVGFKKSDSADLTVENLTPTAFGSWQSFGFDWLVGFDASGTRTNQGSGSGGGEIARTGTSLVSDPAGWSWITVVTPVANFTATPTSGTVSLSVAFTDTSTNTPTSWAWTFGDGGTSTAQNPTHSYTTSGVFTVSLTATNGAGSNTKTSTALVTAGETISYASGGGIIIW